MTPRLLLGVVALAATLVSAQDAARPVAESDAPTTIRGGDPHLVGAARAVEVRIGGIVGAARTPGLLALRADEAARLGEATTRARRVLPPGPAAARGRAWRDLGLGSETAPWDLVVALELDLSGMTFDAPRKHLLVDPQRLIEDAGHGDPNADPDASVLLATGVAPDEPVVGHYVAHAILDGPSPDGPSTTDTLLARAALAEGGANLAAMLLLFGGVGLEAEVVSGGVRPEDALGGRLVPEIMRSGSPVVARLVEFVYLDGFAQAAALAKKGGFARLAQERARRLTTRDVLHLDRTAATPPAIADLALAGGVDLVRVDRDSLGEQGVVTLVSMLTGKDNLGLIAGDGWVADALSRFEPAAGSNTAEGAGVTIWESRWKTEEDAKDLGYGLERCLQARFPGENLVDDPERGGRVLARADRVYRLEVSATEVVFRVAAPSTDLKMGPAPKKKGPEPPQSRPKK